VGVEGECDGEGEKGGEVGRARGRSGGYFNDTYLISCVFEFGIVCMCIWCAQMGISFTLTLSL
jgi:hypothetical protein